MDETIKQKIALLRDARVKAAVLTRTLATRELEARQLRATCEEDYRKGGTDRVAMTKTDAEKAAKLHPDYLAHERETAQLAYERDVVFAAAESQRFEIEALLLAVEVAGRDVVSV